VGKPRGRPLNEHAPPGATGFVYRVDLERNRSPTKRVELGARMGAEQNGAVRQHTIHRHHGGEIVAIDDGEAPYFVLCEQCEALGPLQLHQHARSHALTEARARPSYVFVVVGQTLYGSSSKITAAR
jgi:hypothetical protein